MYFRAIPILRYWNGAVGDHFYTLNFNELGNGKGGYGKEGNMGFMYQKKQPGTVPIYRYWNPFARDHFYYQKKQFILNYFTIFKSKTPKGYQAEGILGYCYPNKVKGTIPFYRYYNGKIADHFYTIYWTELGKGRHGWKLEGIVGYVLKKA